MAIKDRLNVGYFTVTSYCRRGITSPIPDIVHGSSDVQHVIEIENGSTLPHDVIVVNFDPDADPQTPGGPIVIEFSHNGGARRTHWTADRSQIQSGDTRNDSASVYCLATAPGGDVRIHSPGDQIQYRLDSSDSWQTDPTVAGSALSIQLDIT
jgi:hypothetical protein